MDATFLQKVTSDFLDIRFVSGRKFSFRPPNTVVIGPSEIHDSLLLLHEIGHFLVGKYDYTTEVGRLRIEVAAWEEAKKLADRYGVDHDEDVVQGELDSYRDWLHQKSRCPKCGLTRFQTPDGIFHCPKCDF